MPVIYTCNIQFFKATFTAFTEDLCNVYKKCIVQMKGWPIFYAETIIRGKNDFNNLTGETGVYSSMTLCFEHNLILAFAHLEKNVNTLQLSVR